VGPTEVEDALLVIRILRIGRVGIEGYSSEDEEIVEKIRFLLVGTTAEDADGDEDELSTPSGDACLVDAVAAAMLEAAEPRLVTGLAIFPAPAPFLPLCDGGGL
jgi:hypothetical protein